MKKNDENKILKTLKEVQDWTFKMMEKNEFYIYRGQGDSKWDLDSVFARKNQYAFQNKKIMHFNYIKDYFIEKNKIIGEDLEIKDDLSLLGKMQHNGHPTPLIDFTEDIFVALWFGSSYFPEIENDLKEPKSFRIFYFNKKNGEHSTKLDIKKIKMDEIITLKFNTGQKISRSISQKSIFVFDNQNLKEEMKYIDIKNDFDLKIAMISWLKKWVLIQTHYSPMLKVYSKILIFCHLNIFLWMDLKWWIWINLKKLQKNMKK